MKTVLVALALVGLTTVAAIDRDSNLLASQTGDRKRISSSKLNALQALGVGLDNSASAKVAVDAKAETTAVGTSIEEGCMNVPLSLCLGDGTKMLAADAHGKTLVGWWQFDDISQVMIAPAMVVTRNLCQSQAQPAVVTALAPCSTVKTL